MRGTTCCEQDASLAIIRRALRFEHIVANADVATTTYSYDANGNLIQAGGWSYMWDYLNRMLASGYANSTTTYAYDPSGARVLQTSTTSTTYYPNKYYSFTSTKIGANTYATTTNYIWNGDTLLATIDQKLYNGAATGSPITRYVHPDHLGSTNAVTDQNGSLVQLLDYYPYGATRVSTSSYPTNERRQYIDQFNDAQTGLNYLNARYYNPQQGQFISQDSAFIYNPRNHLRDPQGSNAYSYGRDNPVTLLDTNGLDYAYFAARPALTIAGVTGYHIYETYSIDSQARANQLNIGLPIPTNVSADNPFNFTVVKGVDLIACTSVNDVFVLDAWAKASGARDTVTFPADGNGDFAKAIRLEMDGAPSGLGIRSKRYAMLVEDGVVKALHVEDTPRNAVESSAERLLADL